ncbi:MAG TPA: TetR/AcrR family transcriptional regulator [bacterium]|nr:TetR/AcrR family transcriptional regulator [bacterium]
MVRLSETARDERAEERRGQILKAALVVFSQRGFHGATIREIASAAGLAEGTIYLYFPSKQEVLRGVFALIAEEAFAASVGGDFSGGDDEAFLRRFLEGRITSLSKHAAFLRLSVHEADLQEDLRQEFYARLCEPFVVQFERYLQARIAEGAFRPVNTALTATMYFRMLMSHIVVQHVLTVDATAAQRAGEDYLGTMVSLMLYGLAVRPASAPPRDAL